MVLDDVASPGAALTNLPAAYNIRDLGGLRLKDGGRTAHGRIYRGAFSTFALEPQSAIANPLGLRAVVDLRRFGELEHERVEWAALGVRYIHCPFANADGDTWSLKYTQYLENRPARVVAAVRALADVDNHPALFHCAAGKDRTGVLAAVVLDAVGVDRREIEADYLRTAEVFAKVLDRMRRQAPYRDQLATSRLNDLMPDVAALRDFLSWLDREGGTVAWLQRHGLKAREISTLRAAMAPTVAAD